MLLYFGYGIWHSKEGLRSFEKKIFLKDISDRIDIIYEMEIIPAHREDTLDLSATPLKGKSYGTENNSWVVLRSTFNFYMITCIKQEIPVQKAKWWRHKNDFFWNYGCYLIVQNNLSEKSSYVKK